MDCPDTALAPVRHDGWTEPRRELFIETLRATCSVTAAAQSVGLSTTSAYRLRAREPEFAAMWAAALDEATDELETVLRRRVIEGVERPIVRGAKVVATVRDYSDRLAMHLLTMRRGGKYGAIREHVPTAPVEEPIPSWKRGEDARLSLVKMMDDLSMRETGKPFLPANHGLRQISSYPPPHTYPAHWKRWDLEDVEDVKQDDDRDRDADQPE